MFLDSGPLKPGFGLSGDCQTSRRVSFQSARVREVEGACFCEAIQMRKTHTWFLICVGSEVVYRDDAIVVIPT